MLFVLTGDVQTGKTRWLQRLVESLRKSGVACAGVLAPGVWRDWRECEDVPEGAQVDANGFEKLGIDNVLLPQGERLSFAVRADLAKDCAENQSTRAGLRWRINETAIETVNSHFADLRGQSARQKTFVIVDELGILELKHGGGLTEAVGFLEDGPSGLFEHALVVVREALCPLLDGRFELWGEKVPLLPQDSSMLRVLGEFD